MEWDDVPILLATLLFGAVFTLDGNASLLIARFHSISIESNRKFIAAVTTDVCRSFGQQGEVRSFLFRDSEAMSFLAQVANCDSA